MAKINCPYCKKELAYKAIKDLPYFPFCSNRCKLLDLGAWIDEKYRIEEPISPEMLSEMGKEGEEEENG
ncbi:MAG: DNA gyrase inhibitor YacG [wastewater metagenome]|nr:DNA gyrase inhibitor YacG [Candidatus Loosdrechtia aerotolerans]